MPRGKSRGVWVTLFSVGIGAPGALVVGLWAYDVGANAVPPFRPPSIPMPSPNGYDQARKLTARLPEEPYREHPKWPHAPPERLRALVLPVLPTLNAIRATFKLPWRTPLTLNPSLQARNLPTIWKSGSYFLAAGVLAGHEGEHELAMQRALDAMELAAKGACGGSLAITGSASSLHFWAMADARYWAAATPTAAIPGLMERLRRIRRAWPTEGEVLEAERLTTLAHASRIYRVLQPRTPLPTLRLVRDAVESAFRGAPDRGRAYLRYQWTWKRGMVKEVDHYFLRRIAECKKPVALRQAVPLPHNDYAAVHLAAWACEPVECRERIEPDLVRLEQSLLTRLRHSRGMGTRRQKRG